MAVSSWRDSLTTVERDAPDSLGASLDSPPTRASLVIYAREGVRVCELLHEQEVLVGRAAPADVRVDDMTLSRRHARFYLGDGGIEVEDLGSRNGTFVAGQRVHSARLRSGDEVRLGEIVVSVHMHEPTASPLGFSTYEQLERAVEQEVVRARTFGQSFAVMAVYAPGGPGVSDSARHVARWARRVKEVVRPVDTVAVHGRHSVLLLLPECAGHPCERLASEVLRQGQGLTLCGGIATFPQTGASPRSLISDAQTAARSATAEAPLHFVGHTPPELDGAPTILAEATRRLFSLAERVALNNVPVLITGETGSGKEVVATHIHHTSRRSKRRMVAINCAALPVTLIETALFGHERGAFTGADAQKKGAFEEADGSTLFLDEVGELSAAAQAALLRVLETKRLSRVGSTREIEVDVRVLAATHRDLEAMVRSGEFREDLYYRLNAVTLRVPPLRERPDEILPLARMFLDQTAHRWNTVARDFSRATVEVLLAHDWKGNVRELRNAVERAAVVCAGGVVEPEDLPERLQSVRDRDAAERRADLPSLAPPEELDGPFRDRVRNYEIKLITDALDATGGNQSRAAEVLQMPLRTLVHKIRAYGLKRRDLGSE